MISPREPTPGNAPRGLPVAAAHALAAAFTLAPLLFAAVPPLVDYPPHLARMWVLTHADRVPDLAANYVVHWRLLPYLAMDAVVVALAWLMPVETAARLFVALSMLSLPLGAMALRRALFGRVGLWPLAGLLFVYNAVLFWGFLSCLFSLGLALAAFAGWIATARWRPAPRLALFGAVGALLVLSHLFAFGVYGLLVAAWEGGQALRPGRPWRAALPGLLARGAHAAPALLVWRLSLAQGGPTHTQYGDLGDKLIAALAPLDFGFAPATFDILLWVGAALFLALALSRRRLRLAPAMRLPLASLLVAALLMPNWVSGSWGADMRLPVALPFVLIASTRLELARRPAIALALLGGLLLAARVWSVGQSFADHDRWFAEFRAASAAIPPGARLLVVAPAPPDAPPPLPGVPRGLGNRHVVTFHQMPALAVIDRAAFYPTFFGGWTTVEAAPRHRAYTRLVGRPMTPEELLASADPAALAALAALANTIGEQPHWHDWPTDFDYVAWLSFESPRPAVARLEQVAAGSYFGIYRILRQ